MAGRSTRHLTPREINHLIDWILERPSSPTWQDVASYASAAFGVIRQAEAVRRRKELKTAMDARKTVDERTPETGNVTERQKPTARRLNALEEENRRLRAENALLQKQLTDVLDRNIRLVNAMRLRMIPESQIEEPLPPINREPTVLSTKQKRHRNR